MYTVGQVGRTGSIENPIFEIIILVYNFSVLPHCE